DIDGKAVNKPTIEQSDILSGDHTITFGMASEPQTWGSGGTTAVDRVPYIDAAKPDFGTVTTEGADLSLLVDDNSRTSVVLPQAQADITWTSTTGPVSVPSYTLTNGASGAAPKAWTLSGSNDGDHWTVVDHRAGQTFKWATQTRSFSVASPALYTRYRLSIEATSTGAPARLAELELLDDTLVQDTNLAIYPSTKLSASIGSEFSGSLAIVKGGSSTASDYDAQVDFLDGAGPVAGTVSKSNLGGVKVTANHTFTEPGRYTVRVTVSTVVNGQPATVSGITTITVSRNATFEAAFDNACLSTVGTAASCDGLGYAYDKAKLATSGFVQGTTVPLGATGLTFDLPVTVDGKPDNATAHGQRVRLNVGEGATKLAFIGTANEGQQSGTATIEYSDGSTQAVPVTFGDWVGAANTPAAGTTIVATVPSRMNGANGTDNQKTAIFATTPVDLKAGVTPLWLTLPNINHSAREGQLHFFAIASDGVRTPVAPLAANALTVDDQLTWNPATLALAEVSGGQPADGYTANVNWGDETPVQTATVEGGVVRAEHEFAAPGDYAVTVTVDDGVTSAAVKTTVTVRQSVYTTALTVTPHQVAPGDSVDVHGTGFAKGEQVVVKLATDPQVTSTVTASSNGEISATLAVPAGSNDGTYPVTALGARSSTVAESSVAVVRPLINSTLTLAASATSATVGQKVTLTATLTGGGTGAVEFLDGAKSLGMSAIVSGKSTLAVDSFAAGTHQITARYVGDSRHTAAASGTVRVTVNKVAVSLGAPKFSRTSTVYGSSSRVTVTATVTGVTSGVVTFKRGTSVLGTAVIGKGKSGYQASLLLPRTLPAGRYVGVKASVQATAATSAATSAASSQVLVVAKAVTSGVKVSGQPFAAGTRPAVAVTVSKLSNGSYPSGKVRVYVGKKLATTVSLPASAHGRVMIWLPKKYSSTIKVKATFVPSDTHNVSGKSSPWRTLKAVR
ncbi:MAG: Ig-like domain repeat protein, partial [Brevundimonas sp.]